MLIGSYIALLLNISGVKNGVLSKLLQYIDFPAFLYCCRGNDFFRAIYFNFQSF